MVTGMPEWPAVYGSHRPRLNAPRPYNAPPARVSRSNLGLFDRAVDDYTRALELDPANAAAYNNRGYAWRKLGRYDAAVADYTRSLELEPDNIKTLNNRGYSHAKSGAYDAAIAGACLSLDLEPPPRWSNRWGDHPYPALPYPSPPIAADYSRVIVLDPTNAHAYHNRGISYDKKGQYEAAIAGE